MEIQTNKTLEVSNLLSLRVKTTQQNLQKHIEELLAYAMEQGAQKCGNAISATYSVDPTTSEMDIEFYFPIDKSIPNKGNFIFKPKLCLYNCLMFNYKGNPLHLQEGYNKLNEYIATNYLTPISPGFNITIFEILKPEDIDKFEVDIYISISPNIF